MQYNLEKQQLDEKGKDLAPAKRVWLGQRTESEDCSRCWLDAPAIARLLRINVGKARRIAVKMALERMNAELARSRVQLGDPA